MNERIRELAGQAGFAYEPNKDQLWVTGPTEVMISPGLEKFAELIVRECIDKIETHQIPVGNSAAGEIACELTYDSLKEIRDDIKETFGVE